jgi:hypothetical protein
MNETRKVDPVAWIQKHNPEWLVPEQNGAQSTPLTEVKDGETQAT